MLRNFVIWFNKKYGAEILFLVLSKGNEIQYDTLFRMIKKQIPISCYDIITKQTQRTSYLSLPIFRILRSRLFSFLASYRNLIHTINDVLRDVDYDLMINSTGIAPMLVDNEILYIQPGSMDLCTGEFLSDKYRKLFWYILARYAKKAHRLIREKKLLLIANSKFTKAFFSKLYGTEEIYTIYPRSILMDLLAKRTIRKHKKDAAKSIISYTRFVRGKKFEDLIKATIILRKKLKHDYKVILAGFAQDKHYIRTLINDAQKVKQIVSFSFNLSRQEALNLLLQSDIYVHTSRCEPFGLSVLEAMGAKNAIVSHMSGGPWLDILEKGRWGLGYKNAEELAMTLSNLLENDDYLEEYQELARIRFEYFEKRNSSEEFVNLVKSYFNI